VRRSIKNNEEFLREFLKLKDQYEHAYNKLYKKVLESLEFKPISPEEEVFPTEAGQTVLCKTNLEAISFPVTSKFVSKGIRK